MPRRSTWPDRGGVPVSVEPKQLQKSVPSSAEMRSTSCGADKSAITPQSGSPSGRVPRRSSASIMGASVPGMIETQGNTSVSIFSAISSGLKPSITITRPPVSRAYRAGSVAPMWNSGGQHRLLLDGRSPRSNGLTWQRATSLRWVSTAPFGSPVVPLVYRISSGCSGAATSGGSPAWAESSRSTDPSPNSTTSAPARVAAPSLPAWRRDTKTTFGDTKPRQ